MLRVSGRAECADEVPLSAEIGGSDRLEAARRCAFVFSVLAGKFGLGWDVPFSFLSLFFFLFLGGRGGI